MATWRIRSGGLAFLSILASLLAFSAGCGSSDSGEDDPDDSSCSRSGAWTTVDDFGLSSSADADAAGAAVDSDGAIYIVGRAFDGVDYHWVVRKSEDKGATWATVDDFQLNAGEGSRATAIASDSNGNLYVVGEGVSASQYYWVARKSSDGGDNWETVDQFQLSSGRYSLAASVATDANGSIYAAGVGENGSSISTWLVRRSDDSGATWTTSDSYLYTAGYLSGAKEISVSGSGGIYVAGEGSDATSTHWIVRKSSDSGASWELIDDYLGDGEGVSPASISAGRDGDLVVIGQVTQAGQDHDSWLVRSSQDDGATWNELDLFDYVSGQDSSPWAVLLEPSGTVTAIGSAPATDGSGTHWLTRTASSLSGSWSTIDDYLNPDGTTSSARATVISAEGDQFVAGVSAQRWTVRVQRCL